MAFIAGNLPTIFQNIAIFGVGQLGVGRGKKMTQAYLSGQAGKIHLNGLPIPLINLNANTGLRSLIVCTVMKLIPGTIRGQPIFGITAD